MLIYKRPCVHVSAFTSAGGTWATTSPAHLQFRPANNGWPCKPPSRAGGGPRHGRGASNHRPAHAHHRAEELPRGEALCVHSLAQPRPQHDPRGAERAGRPLFPSPRPPHAEGVRLLHQGDGEDRVLGSLRTLPARVSLQRPRAGDLSAAGRLSVEEDRAAHLKEGGSEGEAHRVWERGDVEAVSAQRVLQIWKV